MTIIDINCDMGESFGAYTIGADEEMMDLISSANIACGMHAGDPNVMEQSVRLAKQKGVSIGAHPGFPDLSGFGRRMMDVTEEDVYRLIIYQIGALHAFCVVHDVRMNHVKPHGALYNLAARNYRVARAIAKAVYDFDSSLILVGLANSEILTAGRDIGLTVAAEAFADRTYTSKGTLTPRSEEGALIERVEDAVQQIKQMVFEHKLRAADGTLINMKADTICIHGDNKAAVTFARKLRMMLTDAGITVSSLSRM